MFNPDIFCKLLVEHFFFFFDKLKRGDSHFGADDAFNVDKRFVDCLKSAFPYLDLEFFPPKTVVCVCGAEGGGVGCMFDCDGFSVAFGKVEVFMGNVDGVEKGWMEICNFFGDVAGFGLISSW